MVYSAIGMSKQTETQSNGAVMFLLRKPVSHLILQGLQRKLTTISESYILINIQLLQFGHFLGTKRIAKPNPDKKIEAMSRMVTTSWTLAN